MDFPMQRPRPRHWHWQMHPQARRVSRLTLTWAGYLAVALVGICVCDAATLTNVNIISPPSGSETTTVSSTSSQVLINFELPEAPKNNTVKLFFNNLYELKLGGDATVWSFNLDLLNWAGSSEVLEVFPPSVNRLPQGLGTLFIKYQNAADDPEGTSDTSSNILVDTSTTQPHLDSPPSLSLYRRNMRVQGACGENFAPGSVNLTFVRRTPLNPPHSFTMNLEPDAQSLSVDFTWVINYQSTLNLTGLPINYVAGDADLPDGLYSALLRCSDTYGNPYSEVESGSIQVNGTLLPATIHSALTGTLFDDMITINFTVPEKFAPGGVTVTFQDEDSGNGATLTMTNSPYGAWVELQWDPATDPTALANVAASTNSSIPDGTYTVQVRWEEFYEHTVLVAERTGVVVDTRTTPGIVTLPDDGFLYTTLIRVTYSLPDKPLSGSVRLEFTHSIEAGKSVTLIMTNSQTANFLWKLTDPADSQDLPVASVSSSQMVLVSGRYTVALSYQDERSNARVEVSKTNVFVDTTNSPVSRVSLILDIPFSTVDADDVVDKLPKEMADVFDEIEDRFRKFVVESDGGSPAKTKVTFDILPAIGTEQKSPDLLDEIRAQISAPSSNFRQQTYGGQIVASSSIAVTEVCFSVAQGTSTCPESSSSSSDNTLIIVAGVVGFALIAFCVFFVIKLRKCSKQEEKIEEEQVREIEHMQRVAEEEKLKEQEMLEMFERRKQAGGGGRKNRPRPQFGAMFPTVEDEEEEEAAAEENSEYEAKYGDSDDEEEEEEEADENNNANAAAAKEVAVDIQSEDAANGDDNDDDNEDEDDSKMPEEDDEDEDDGGGADAGDADSSQPLQPIPQARPDAAAASDAADEPVEVVDEEEVLII